MFRGMLMLGVGGGFVALVLSSAAHSAWYRRRPISYAFAFGFALLFGTVTLLTGSLWPAIAMHGLSDFFGNADPA